MCHLVVALNAHPDFPFVLGANRDEFSDRPFDDARAHPGGIVCGLDRRSQATWLAIHPEEGHLATLTNIGGRGARGGGSRGALVSAFASDPDGARALLERRARYRGFNLLWCEDVRAARPRIRHVSNCDPSDSGVPARPPITTIEVAPGAAGLVVAVGNDLPGDEHVKSPYLEQQTTRLLGDLASAGAVPTQSLDAHAAGLRDALTSVLCHRSIGAYPTLALLEKFIRWSRRRRLQPGSRTALILVAVLAGLAAMLTGPSVLPLLLAVGVGLAVGLWHHLRMQHLFVDVPAGTRRWTTVAQTVVLVDRRGTLYFSQRRTVHGPEHAGPWVSLSFPRT